MRIWYAVTFVLALTACGGGGGGGEPAEATAGSAPPPTDPSGCDGSCADPGVRLSVADVQEVLAQGIQEAEAMGASATIAVVDRVGNVLAVHRMAANSGDVEIATEFPPTVSTGLEGVILPAGSNGDALAAIAKAVTGAFLSSEGNAFSTRTANQIVQEHFNPGEFNQPSGPLFGVQFSQLACSDFTLASSGAEISVGPQRSPLGLSADPGGFPLYKAGTPVGGVGVIADGRYSIDKNILDIDDGLDERIALAATFGFAAPRDRRGDNITVEGKTFRFSDIEFSELVTDPAQANDYASQTGATVAVAGYTDGVIKSGSAFGTPDSGVVPSSRFTGRDAFVFVDAAGLERFPPTDGSAAIGDAAPLSEDEVTALIDEALSIANRARAQIRRPVGTTARVTISVVDAEGAILGIARTRDAPVFGADVSLQKARTAALFSSPSAAAFLRSIEEPAVYLNPDLTPKAEVFIGDYVDALQAFVGGSALTDGIAFSDRAGGNLSRPFFPDGIRGTVHGPLSKSFSDNEWSVFSSGLQLDLVYNQIIAHIAFALGLSNTDVGGNCVAGAPRIANGTQIFPGSVPIYRGDQLIGGIGVSGDGIDQDDMISFLGVHQAGIRLDGAINNAPKEIRADQLTPAGERLRYVQCPFAPFVDSDEERVCDGL